MREINSSGRTVLFVSHNLASVQRLCTSVMVLANGKEWYRSNDVESAIAAYEKISVTASESSLAERRDRTGEGRIKIIDFTVTNRDGVILDRVHTGQEIIFVFKYEILEQEYECKDVLFSLTINSRNGNALSMLGSHLSGEKLAISKRTGRVSCSINNFPFTEGIYDINVIVRNSGIAEDYIISAYQLHVFGGDYYKANGSLNFKKNSVLINCKWSFS